MCITDPQIVRPNRTCVCVNESAREDPEAFIDGFVFRHQGSVDSKHKRFARVLRVSSKKNLVWRCYAHSTSLCTELAQVVEVVKQRLEQRTKKLVVFIRV